MSVKVAWLLLNCMFLSGGKYVLVNKKYVPLKKTQVGGNPECVNGETGYINGVHKFCFNVEWIDNDNDTIPHT